jgi:hypothetical protein
MNNPNLTPMLKGSRTSLRNSDSSDANEDGGGCLILFGLFFALIGGIFTVVLANDFIENAKTHFWIETPAEITSFEILAEESRKEDPFKAQIEYRYNHEGQSYTSSNYSRKEDWTDNYEKLALKRAAFFNGDGTAVCYVNPDDSAEAVISRESLWKCLFILFPLLFVAVGLIIIWAGISSFKKKRAARNKTPESISSKAKSTKASPIAIIIFFSIFAAVGLGILFPLAISPFRKLQAAKNWIETPCTILWSRVASHDSDDGTTYSVDIFYEYEFNSQKHRSNKYHFSSDSSSGRGAKAAVVKKYPRRSAQTCYIDPLLPERAVINRDLNSIGFWFLIPLVFLLVGLGGMFSGIQKLFNKSKIPGILTSGGAHSLIDSVNTSPRTLTPAKGRKIIVIGLGVFALIWNGIMSVFLIADLKEGSPFGWFSALSTLFMIPFVLIGLALIVAFLHQLLALFNPRMELTLTPGTQRLGDTVHLRWRMSGSSSRLKSIKVVLTGTESATYQRGTNTSTDNEIFYAHTLVEESNALSAYQGEAQFQIPFDLIYSIDTGNNKIKWEIQVIGVIKPGPDIKDTSEIQILPAS